MTTTSYAENDLSAPGENAEAGFKLYTGDGLQIYFKISGRPDEHPTRTFEYIARLLGLGLTVSPPGEIAGARIETVDAYVMSESSKGDACVYLYSANHGLQFRIATVWVERFSELPFTPTGTVWSGSAPERDLAAKKKYLVDISPMDIVLEPQFNADGSARLTKNGNPVYEFARVRGSMPTPASTPAPAPAPAPAPDPAPDLAPKPLCPNCKQDWRLFNPDCANHTQPGGADLPQHFQKPPLEPSELRIFLTRLALDARRVAATLSQTEYQELDAALATLPGKPTSATVERMLKAITGFTLNTAPPPVQVALHGWLVEGDKKVAATEASLVLKALAKK